MQKFNTGWYLIYTKPKHEKKVQTKLLEKRVESFFPSRMVWKRYRDRNKLKSEPLFPSYIFVYLNNIHDLYSALSTDGALYYVRDGKGIARVDDHIISNIKLSLRSGESIEISEERFKKGGKCRVVVGPFSGMCCEIVQSDGKQKLLVRMDLLSRNILVTMPESSLTADNNLQQHIAS